jgi:hypothetical protein
MRREATIMLEIIRMAIAEGVWLPQELGPILHTVLGITEREALEIGEILKADARERFANHPDFTAVNAELEKFPKM